MASWKKGKQLGSGTYGTVHLATSASSPYPMAVKSVDGSLSFAVESLNREAKVLHHLAGAPNVVQSFGKYQTVENNRPTHNLLLEYAPYGSLEDVIKKVGPMPEWKVACYAGMLLRGIDAIHNRGLVHCDLKSANILVFPGPSEGISWELKIADLGLAKWVSEGLCKQIPTWEGSWGSRYYNVGTAATASPESVLCHFGNSGYGGYHGPCADIWSIGCIIYEMMTGNSVWEWNGNMEYLYRQILNRPIPAFPRNLSQDGVHFLKCCLNKDWSSRWSAKQLLMHPFIVNNTFGINHPRRDHVYPRISRQDLYSQRTIESAASCYYKNTAAVNTSYRPQLLV